MNKDVNNIKCPFCNSKIGPDNEACPNCHKALPWMSHIYKRETSFFRALRTMVVETFNAVAEKRSIDKSKVLGLINAFLVSRMIIALGSIIGLAFLIMELLFLVKQNQIMSIQNDLLKSQNNLVSFEQSSRIIDYLKNSKNLHRRENLITSPNKAIISQIKHLAINDSITLNILKELLWHSDPSVQIGALYIIDDLPDILFKKLKPFYSISLKDIYLEGFDFERYELDIINIENSLIRNCIFDMEHAEQIEIDGCIIDDCTFTNLNLPDLIIYRSSLHQCDFINGNAGGEIVQTQIWACKKSNFDFNLELCSVVVDRDTFIANCHNVSPKEYELEAKLEIDRFCKNGNPIPLTFKLSYNFNCN